MQQQRCGLVDVSSILPPAEGILGSKAEGMGSPSLGTGIDLGRSLGILWSRSCLSQDTNPTAGPVFLGAPPRVSLGLWGDSSSEDTLEFWAAPAFQGLHLDQSPPPELLQPLQSPSPWMRIPVALGASCSIPGASPELWECSGHLPCVP